MKLPLSGSSLIMPVTMSLMDLVPARESSYPMTASSAASPYDVALRYFIAASAISG